MLVTFQAYINRALAGLVDVICIVYLDNILIYLDDLMVYQYYVTEVLKCLRRYRLFMKLSKCKFDIDTVEFLAFVLEPDSVALEQSWVQAIQDWLKPCIF